MNESLIGQDQASESKPVRDNLSQDDRNRIALNQTVTFNYDDTPFIDIMEELRVHYHLSAVILDSSASDDSLTEDELVTLKLRDIKLGVALGLLLDNFNATYLVRDEVVRIISKDVAGDIQYFNRRIFNCRPLINKIRNAEESLLVDPKTKLRDPAGHANSNSGAVQLSPESLLLKAIKTGISPNAWGDLTADDSMCFVGGCLIVHQSEMNLQRIRSLLDDLDSALDQE